MDRHFLNVPGWFTEVEGQVLWDFCMEHAKEINTICEIGTWKGRSASILRNFGKLYCIDLWEVTDEGPNTGNFIEEAARNMQADKYDVSLIKGTSDWIPLIKPDLVFVDGSHFYEPVLKDLKNVKDVPLILGHDRRRPGVKRALAEIIEPLGYEIVYPGGSLWQVIKKQ